MDSAYASEAAGEMSVPTAPPVDPWAEERARQEAQRTQENACIDRVVREDVATEIHGNSPSRTTSMRAISMTDCPSEFQVAYVEHIQAWEKYQRIQAALVRLDTGENFGGAALADFVGGALGFQAGAIGSHMDAIKLLERERGVANQEISDTYEIVTTLAGARRSTSSLAEK